MITDQEVDDAVLGDAEGRRRLKEEINAAPERALAALENKAKFLDEVRIFEAEYINELADPFLKALIYDEDARLAAANPQMDYRTRLAMAGNSVRDWHRKTVGSDAAPAEDNEQHVERDPRQRRAAVQAKAKYDESVDGEPSDAEVHSVIDGMAKARGMSRASVHTWKQR